MPTYDPILLGVIDLVEAKRIRDQLEEQGVELTIKNNPETCGSGGCKPRVEVYATEIDMPKVREYFQRERIQSLESLDVDPSFVLALESEVFDPEKESARCPACGTDFSTKLVECPECGLC